MKNESTMQPFSPGDVFLGCTVLNDPNDDHKGDGRILQYDQHLKLKGVLWTEGTTHLMVNLKFDPDGILWAFDIHTHVVVRVDPSGKQLPNQHFADRAFGNVAFDKHGNIYFGEYLIGNKPYEGSFMKRLPVSDKIGDGNIYRFNHDFELQQTYEVETAPEFTGFKGVTHTALHPGGEFITYTTETGKRVMRYDVVNDCQLPDLVTYSSDDGNKDMAIAVAYLPDGRLLLTRGAFFEILDESGRSLHSYDLSELGYGFAAINPSVDGRHVFAANIFTGVMAKVDLETGNVVGTIDTGFKAPHRSLAGVVEFPG